MRDGESYMVILLSWLSPIRTLRGINSPSQEEHADRQVFQTVCGQINKTALAP